MALDQWKYIDTTPEHYKSMSWCIQNDIKVYPKKTKEGFKLICQEAKIETSGASNVEVQVIKNLIAKGSGASNIEYKGNPNVNSEMSGASDISKK